jgi:type IV secretory pathway VirJ component
LKLRALTLAAVAASAALALTACGDGEADSATPATTSSAPAAAATTSAAPAIAALPTAAEFNELLAKGMDLNVPLEEKNTLVVGTDEDPELINKVAEAAVQQGVQVTVVDPIIETGDGTALGQVELVINGEPVEGGMQVTFTNDGGSWKLSKETACAIVSLAALESPACPAPAPAS